MRTLDHVPLISKCALLTKLSRYTPAGVMIRYWRNQREFTCLKYIDPVAYEKLKAR